MDTRPTYGRVTALIPAAGEGRRMGGHIPKQFMHIGGREVLARTIDVFERCDAIDDVWVVVPAEQCDVCQKTIVERYGFQKVRGVVAGGGTRQSSVWNGLERVAEGVDIIVVHDGVRPFVTEDLLEQTLDGASRYGAAIAAVPLKDTLKRISGTGHVEVTVPREHLWRIQTPQAFRHTLLRQAFQYAWQQNLQVTDEAGLIEALGHPVKIVPSYEHNVKITTPDDLVFCEMFLQYQL